MPYKVEKRQGDGCGADKPWAVVKEDDDSVVGCHETEDEAKEQQKALYAQEGNSEAAATDALAPSAGAAWNATIVLSARTNDGREFDQFEWRELPLPLMWQKEQPESGGHAKSVLVGRIEDLSIVGDKVMGRGVFDTSDDAAEAQRQVGEQMLRWVSADLEPVDGVIEIIEEGDCSEEGYIAGDCQLVMRVPNARIMGACYDDQTEVLTEHRSWQKFDALTQDDRVATRNPKTGEFEWQLPYYAHHDAWNGPMVRITSGGQQAPEGTFKHRGLDLLVTPNHRMMVVDNYSGQVMFVPAEDLLNPKVQRRYRIPATSSWFAPDVQTVTIESDPVPEGECACGCGESAGVHEGATGGGRVVGTPRATLPGHGHGLNRDPLVFDGDDFAAFMGMWLSEGSRHAKGVAVSQRESSKGYEMFSELIGRMFPRAYRHEDGWNISNVRLSRWLTQFGTAREKFIPEMVKSMSARQLRIFWDFYIAGDGDVEGRRVYTSSRRMAGELQEIAQKLGMWAVVNQRPDRTAPVFIDGREIKPNGPSYVVAVRNRPGSRRAEAIWDWEAELVPDHVGDVRCVSVPNEALYVRRNGIPAWCGNTLLTFPAFPEAVIALDGADLEQATEAGLQAAASLSLKPVGCSPCAEALIAAAIPAKPPREWFEMEEPDEPTPMELTEDGRYFGHVALYSECHIGFADQCVTAPRSNSDYSYFLTGEVECADGSKIPTGVISVGAGHADVRLSASRASAHYDDASAGVADVTAKDGKHGIWVCGALRPNVTEDQIRTLRASSPSGDWRRIRGGLEMVAVLAVNVPGFPVTRARVASGQMQTLVAAGHMPREEMQKRRQQVSLERRIARLEALTMPLHVQGLRARIRPPSAQMVASSNGAG